MEKIEKIHKYVWGGLAVVSAAAILLAGAWWHAWTGLICLAMYSAYSGEEETEKDEQ